MSSNKNSNARKQKKNGSGKNHMQKQPKEN